jgi:hypothetical protein
MAGAHACRERHNACVLHRCGAATDADRTRRPRRHTRAGARREVGGLHGRWLCARCWAPRHLLRAVGRRGEPGGRFAGCVVRPQPGDRADRARATALSSSQHVSGNPASAALCVGDEVLGRCRGCRRPATFAAPGMARGDDGFPAAGTSRSVWPFGERRRDQHGERARDFRSGAATDDAPVSAGAVG